MASQVKPSKQIIIDAIIKEIGLGKGRAFVLRKIAKKCEISRGTFDRHWKTANDQHKERQALAKAASDEAYIQASVKAAEEAVMTEIEAKQKITAIGRGNLADYMIVKKVEHTPRIEITLKQHIKNLKDKIQFEEEFVKVAGYTEDEMNSHIASQKHRKREVARQELLLKKNKAATIIVDGPVEWRETTELDMVKLVADKERGIIKSIAHTQFGIKVEMYDAADAAVQFFKIHGSYAPIKNANTDKDGNDKPPPISESKVDEVLTELRKLVK